MINIDRAMLGNTNEKADKVIFIASIFFFVILLAFSVSIVNEQHFSYLASSFLQGKAYFVDMPGSWADSAPFNNSYYWAEGPFPSILLLPFVLIFNLIGKFFYQGYIQFFLVVGVFCLVYRIAQKYKYTSSDSLFLAFAFCFASAFIGVALMSWSWYFSQVVTVFLLWLFFYEYLLKKRFWLIGIISGALLLTRAPASWVIIIVALETLLNKKKSFLNKVKTLTQLFTPYLIASLILISYNYIRFGNFLEQGYSLVLVPNFHVKAREYGMFSLQHLPGNLYYFLLGFPLPIFKDGLSHVLKLPFVRANPWGMSIFVTSPIFLQLFFLKHKDCLSKLLLATVILISMPIFFYYGIGYRQFGYRYSLDFLPLLFVLLIKNYRKKHASLLPTIKILILVSALTNLYLFFTLFMIT